MLASVRTYVRLPSKPRLTIAEIWLRLTSGTSGRGLLREKVFRLYGRISTGYERLLGNKVYQRR